MKRKIIKKLNARYTFKKKQLKKFEAQFRTVLFKVTGRRKQTHTHTLFFTLKIVANVDIVRVSTIECLGGFFPSPLSCYRSRRPEDGREPPVHPEGDQQEVPQGLPGMYQVQQFPNYPPIVLYCTYLLFCFLVLD